MFKIMQIYKLVYVFTTYFYTHMYKMSFSILNFHFVVLLYYEYDMDA